MAKTDLTKQIEIELVKKYYYDNNHGGMGRRFALECQVYSQRLDVTERFRKSTYHVGRVDFVTLHQSRQQDILSCFEIKISKSDFKSKNGHNFIGDYNYYVIPIELLDYVKTNRKDTRIGIIVYDPDDEIYPLSTVVKPRRFKDRFMKQYNDEKIKHNMLTACNSTVRRLLMS